MRTSVVVVIVTVLCAVVAAAQQSATAGPEQYAGLWSGSWDGEGSPGGGFELTLEKPKDGKMAGGVSVTGEPTYKAVLKTVAFDGNKMTATYDFPPEESIEILLTATFDGKSATGTWSAREKGSGSEMAGGGWKVSRK